MADVDVPNKVNMGFKQGYRTIIKTIEHNTNIVKDVFITKFAFVLFFSPRPIENNGAPPLPNRFANAFIITIKEKHNPIAPNAYVPIPGIRAI